MSKYKTIETEFRNAESLSKALQEIIEQPGLESFPLDKPQHLVGYRGDQRPERSQFIIRQQAVNRYSGGSSNDIGFTWNGRAYTAIVSEYDSGREGVTAMLSKVKQRYAYHEVSRQAHIKGYTVREHTLPNGAIQLTLSHR